MASAAVAAADDLVAFPRQQGSEDVANDFFVVDDEDPHEGDPARHQRQLDPRLGAPALARSERTISPP